MKNIIVLIFLINVAYAAGSWTGSGSRQETFSQGLKFGTGITVESVSTTPTLSARSALKGSVVTNANGLFWKQDNGSSTNWKSIVTDFPIFSSISMNGLNTITTTATNGDLDLVSDGTGKVYVKNGSDIKKKIGSNNPELNILQKYPSFEESILEPTYASATAAQITSTEGFGLKSAQFVTTASATGTMTMDTANSVSTAQQAVVKVGIKTSSSGVQLITRSDGADISTQDIPSDGKFYTYEIPVVCGLTSCGYKILGDNDAAVETAEVAYAYVAMGEVKQTIKESGFFGSLKWITTTSCNWSSTNAAFSAFSADAECDDNARVARGNVTSVVTAGNAEGQVPQIKFASMPAGTYQIVASGSFNHDTSAANASLYRFNDGTDSTSAVAVYEAASVQVPHIIGTFYYDAPKTNVTINLQVNTQSTGSTVAVAYSDLEFTVYYYPPTNTSIYSSLGQGSSQITWRSLANCSPSFTGTDTVLNDTDCTYAAAELIGSTATPTTTGDIALKVPLLKAGQYKISALVPMSSSTQATTCEANLYANGSEIIHGTTNSQVTGIDGGTSIALEKIVNITADVTNYEVILRGTRQQGAGTCSVNAATGAPNSAMLIAIEPISQIITGSFKEVVTTPGVASPKMCSFTINTTSDTVTAQSGNCFSSTSCTGVSGGKTTCTFASSYWAAKPLCAAAPSDEVQIMCASGSAATPLSSTTIQANRASSVSGVDGTCDYVCTGY